MKALLNEQEGNPADSERRGRGFRGVGRVTLFL